MSTCTRTDAHAMGNSTGNLDEYWDLIRSEPVLQGGFIWDWVDQGLLRTDQAGNKYWGYGGDFGESIHDSQFNINGIVFPDRSLHPACAEVKKWYQPFAITATFEHAIGNEVLGSGTVVCAIEFQNRHNFASFDALNLVWDWVLEREGVEQQSAESPKCLPPTGPNGGLANVNISLAALKRLHKGDEVFLTVRVCLGQSTAWADKGHCLGFEQFAVPVVPAPATDYQLDAAGPFSKAAAAAIGASDAFGPFQVLEKDGQLQVVGRASVLAVSLTTGQLLKIECRGLVLVEQEEGVAGGSSGGMSGLQSFWRAHTDNDNGGTDTLISGGADKQVWGVETGYEPSFRIKGPGALIMGWLSYWGDVSYGKQWLRAGMNRLRPANVRVTAETRQGQPLARGATAEYVVVQVMYTMVADGTQTKIPCQTQLHVLPDGEIVMVNECVVPANLPPVARIGMLLSVPGKLDHVTYMGHGPVENYSDRKVGCPIGRYCHTVDDMFVPYLVPSENGTRAGVRWAALETDDKPRPLLMMTDKCKGLMVATGNTTDTLFMSAQRCTPWDLHAAKHPHELPRRPTITLAIDHKHMPCGGNDSWSRSQSPKYLIPAGTYSYSLRLRPLFGEVARPSAPQAHEAAAVCLAGAKFKPVSAWTYWLARTRIAFSLGLAATPLKSLEEVVMLTSWRYGAPMERALQILLFSAVMYTALRCQDFSR